LDDLDQLIGFGFGPNLMPRIDFTPFGGEGREAMWVPALEVAEREGELVIRADVPGISSDQINVEIEDGQLVISGERRQEHEERQGNIQRSERSYGSFYRAISLPQGVAPERAKAVFKDGVLEITIPRTQRPQAQRIEVQPQQANAR